MKTKVAFAVLMFVMLGTVACSKDLSQSEAARLARDYYKERESSPTRAALPELRFTVGDIGKCQPKLDDWDPIAEKLLQQAGIIAVTNTTIELTVEGSKFVDGYKPKDPRQCSDYRISFVKRGEIDAGTVIYVDENRAQFDAQWKWVPTNKLGELLTSIDNISLPYGGPQEAWRHEGFTTGIDRSFVAMQAQRTSDGWKVTDYCGTHSCD